MAVPNERPTALGDEAWLDAAEETLHQSTGLTPVHLDLEGLHCTGCVWVCEELHRRTKLPGSVMVNPATGSLDIWAPPDFPLRDYVRDLAALGYRAGPRRKASGSSSGLITRMGITIALAMNAMIFAIALYAGLGQESSALRWTFHLLELGLAIAAFIVGGSLFVRSAVRGLRRGVLHLDLPIAVGLVLGYAGSTASLILSEGRDAYFDTLVVFTALMLVGRYLRERVLEKNRAQLLDDAGIDGLLVRRIAQSTDGERVEVVPATKIESGDIVLLASHDVMPAAGTLEEEEATLSLEWITGESAPIECKRQAAIPAGAANVGRKAIRVRASEAASTSALMDLLRVPSAVDRYGDVATSFETRLSRFWVIAVLALGSIGFGGWFAKTHDLSNAVSVAVAVLVVTCPCAFGIATPIAYQSVLARLRRSGLLVRSASFLDRATSIRRVVFDKTGTLTTGSLSVDAPALPADASRVLYNLAAKSSHPKAAAIASALPLSAQRLDDGLAVVEEAGKGVSVERDGRVYRLGAPAWAAPTLREAASGDVVFSIDGSVQHVFDSRERIREDAGREVAALQNLGLDVWMLTGDKRDRAQRVAGECGIAQAAVIAEQSPEQKAAWIRSVDHADTLMVGDGVNDGPATNAAFASGTPAAGRAFLAARTDFYLLAAGLAPIRRALNGARALRAALRRNLVFAALYNTFAVSLALAGVMSPLLCAVLMPLSSITSIALALRSLTPFLRDPDHQGV
ncbi:MAG: heavy metal translocating P-type ATPase [Polyangiaceae bacterium]